MVARRDICLAIVNRLVRAGLNRTEANVAAREFIFHVAGCRNPPPSLSFSTQQQKTIMSFAERRANREPLQYILGEWDFRYLTLDIRQPILIPRPETEVLVDLIKHTQPSENEISRFVDIGVGSGAILLSLLHECDQFSGVGIDISPQAIALTLQNATKHELLDRLLLFKQDITKATQRSPCFNNQPFSFIVSNPPYITHEEMRLLDDELRYESTDALCGGSDGLDVARSIIEIAPHILDTNGQVHCIFVSGKWLIRETGHLLIFSCLLVTVDHSYSTEFLSRFHSPFCIRTRLKSCSDNVYIDYPIQGTFDLLSQLWLELGPLQAEYIAKSKRRGTLFTTQHGMMYIQADLGRWDDALEQIVADSCW
eukprot:gene10023-2197_t